MRSHDANAGLAPSVEKVTVRRPCRCTAGRIALHASGWSAALRNTRAASASSRDPGGHLWVPGCLDGVPDAVEVGRSVVPSTQPDRFADRTVDLGGDLGGDHVDDRARSEQTVELAGSDRSPTDEEDGTTVQVE